MESDHYSIDSDRSRLTVKAFASGIFSAMGHNPTLAVRRFTGEARLTPGTLDGAALRIKVAADSLTVLNDISEKDRREIERTMNHEVLETERYPEIVFQSSNVSASKAGDGQYMINLVGDLSLHGVTSSQPISAQVSVMGDTLRANGEFSLQQTTYRIKPVSVAGGTLKLKNEVKCWFEIVAHKAG